MTDKEFNALPASVRHILRAMGVNPENIHIEADKDGNISFMEGILRNNPSDKCEETPDSADISLADIMDMLHQMFESDDDDVDDVDEEPDCMLAKFQAYLDEDPRKIEMMSAAIAADPSVDDALVAKMFKATRECVALTRTFTKKMGPVENFTHTSHVAPFIVPVSGLLKVYAASEEEALHKVHAAIENGYTMPVHHDCLPDASEVAGATLTYIAHQQSDEMIDDTMNGHDCPFHAACDNTHQD